MYRRRAAGLWAAGAVAAWLAAAPGAPAQPAKTEKQIAEEEKRKAEREAEQAAKDRILEFNKSIKGVKSSGEIASAVRSLGDTPHRIIVNKLLQFVTGPGDNATHTAAVDALEQIHDPACVPPLAQALESSLGQVREKAPLCIALCRALGAFGDRRGAPALSRALNSKDTGVMRAACDAAGQVKDPVLIEALVKLLKEASVADATLMDPRGQQYGGRTYENPRKAMRDPARNSLRSITGQGFDGAREWADWWEKNRASWRPPEAAGGRP